MNFNKLGIAVLSSGAIFMATSCNDGTVNLKKATKWVEDNFTHTYFEDTNFTELKVTVNAAGTKGEDAIGNVQYSVIPYGIKNFNKETLKGNATYTKSNMPSITEAIMLYEYIYYYTADSFTATYTDETVKESNTKFSIKDNKLTVSSSNDLKDLEMGFDSGKMKMKDTYNKEGATLYSLRKIENGKSTMYKDQVVNFSIVVTLKY